MNAIKAERFYALFISTVNMHGTKGKLRNVLSKSLEKALNAVGRQSHKLWLKKRTELCNRLIIFRKCKSREI